MCLNPIPKPNVNRGRANVGLNRLKDCTHAFIYVNCGHCEQCIARRQGELVQRCEMMSFDYHAFYMTFTYNNAMIPRFVTSSGFELTFPDFHDVQNAFKRLRKRDPFGRSFKYLVVSEYGEKRHRPHFHCLFFLQKKPNDDYNTLLNLRSVLFDSFLSEWSRNVGTRKNPVYKPLLTYRCVLTRAGWRRNYDVQIVDPLVRGVNSVGFYITKYLLKASDYVDRLHSAIFMNYELDEAWDIWNMVKPRACWSKFFGNPRSSKVVNHLRTNVNASIQNKLNFPYYYSPFDGKGQPLGRYYMRYPDVYDVSSAYQFLFNKIASSPVEQFDGSTISDGIETTRIDTRLSKFEQRKKKVFDKSDFIDDFCENDLDV